VDASGGRLAVAPRIGPEEARDRMIIVIVVVDFDQDYLEDLPRIPEAFSGRAREYDGSHDASVRLGQKAASH